MYWKPVLITPCLDTSRASRAHNCYAGAVLVILSTVKFTAQYR